MLLKSHAGTPACVRPAFAPATIFFVILSCFAFSFIDPHKAAPPVTGVTTELRLDEGTGTTAADASGNAHPGTLTGSATWTAGKYGQSVSLNGTTSYINLADHADFTLTPTVSYTWSAWVRNTNFNQWSTVWSQTVNTSNFFYFYAHTSADAEAGPVTNGISVYWYSGTNKLVLHSNNNVLTAGTWSYVTVTYDASQAQASRFTIYVNGVDVTNRSDVVSAGTLAAKLPSRSQNPPRGPARNPARRPNWLLRRRSSQRWAAHQPLAVMAWSPGWPTAISSGRRECAAGCGNSGCPGCRSRHEPRTMPR